MMRALLTDPVLTCYFGIMLGAAITAAVVILDRSAHRRIKPPNPYNPYARKKL